MPVRHDQPEGATTMTRTLILLTIGFVQGALAMAIALEVAYRVAERRRHRRSRARMERHFVEKGGVDA